MHVIAILVAVCAHVAIAAFALLEINVSAEVRLLVVHLSLLDPAFVY